MCHTENELVNLRWLTSVMDQYRLKVTFGEG
jgi:hypothetical protein